MLGGIGGRRRRGRQRMRPAHTRGLPGPRAREPRFRRPWLWRLLRATRPGGLALRSASGNTGTVSALRRSGGRVLRPQGRYQRRRPAVARGAFRKQPLRLKSRSRSAGLATFRPRVHRPPVSSKLSKATSIFRSRTDPGQGRPGARAPGACMVQREPQERRGQRASWTYCSPSPKVRAGNDARDQPDTDGRTGRARCPRSLSLLARMQSWDRRVRPRLV